MHATDTIKWVCSLQDSSNSTIWSHVGNLSFKYGGCLEGDPVPPYIFGFTPEILIEAIKTNANIRGLHLFGVEHNISR